jgi:predicted  nucleic acid-binding Zn-ribbon protein
MAAFAGSSIAGPNAISSELQSTSRPTPNTVQTEDGLITVGSLESLQQDADELARRETNLLSQIEALRVQAASAQAKAGWLLSGQQASWQSGDRTARIDAARGLGQLVSSLEQSIADIRARPHHGLGGLIQGAKDSHESKSLEEKLRSAQDELNLRYRAVVDRLEPTTGVPGADALLLEASQAEAQVRDLTATHDAMSIEVRRVADEIKRRKDVVSNLGFDALGLEAELKVNGIRPIQTTLVLKPREVAAVEVPATLCRFKSKTEFVGGSHGVSIPLGHGFRYRVSSFRGHPVQSEYLAHLDTGKLIVTNTRLVFLGTKREVSTPIAKLLQIEPYADALGIAREGKETKEIYLVPNPAYVIQYLQWVISQQTV